MAGRVQDEQKMPSGAMEVSSWLLAAAGTISRMNTVPCNLEGHPVTNADVGNFNTVPPVSCKEGGRENRSISCGFQSVNGDP